MASPTLFNVEVYSVVRNCMSLIVEDNSATNEILGMSVGRYMGMFYADDGIVVSRDPEWIQGAINVLIELFRKVILMANLEKSKTMTCKPRDIFTGTLEEYFSQRSKGEGSHIQGAYAAAHPMSRLWCGVNGQVYDRSLQTVACYRSRKLLVFTTSQTYRTLLLQDFPGQPGN